MRKPWLRVNGLSIETRHATKSAAIRAEQRSIYWQNIQDPYGSFDKCICEVVSAAEFYRRLKRRGNK